MAKLEELLSKQRREAEERDAKRRAEHLGLEYLNLVSTGTPTEIKAMQIITEQEARESLATPVQVIRKKLVLAVYDPNLEETKKLIEKLKKDYELTLVISSKSGLEHAWQYYKYIKEEGGEIVGGINIDTKKIEEINERVNSPKELEHEIESFESPRISQILEIVMGGAVALRASDIHLEPSESAAGLRLRIDGMLHTITDSIDKKMHEALITRVKLLSNLKLNVKDEPQDGRFTVSLPGRDIEIRTSILPSEYGETAVLRLLDPSALKVNLEELGWRPDDLEIIKKELEKPNGLILNTGPTGSGKTTTLYAFLRHKVKPEIKVITVEDPIEYHLEGVSQTQVDPDSGYTFASGLRSILRQDPDVILVGEIRDKETAEIAMNASLTGHLVFSTLHTNSAVGAIPRLLDLGAKPHILGPAASVIIAQRLVRKLCEKCKKEANIAENIKQKVQKFVENLPDRVDKKPYSKPKIYEAGNCKECGGLGYKGRTSIFELFVITNKIEEAIYGNPTEIELMKLAREQGMTTMQEDGVLKVLRGITSFQEIERLTGPIQWK